MPNHFEDFFKLERKISDEEIEKLFNRLIKACQKKLTVPEHDPNFYQNNQWDNLTQEFQAYVVYTFTSQNSFLIGDLIALLKKINAVDFAYYTKAIIAVLDTKSFVELFYYLVADYLDKLKNDEQCLQDDVLFIWLFKERISLDEKMQSYYQQNIRPLLRKLDTFHSLAFLLKGAKVKKSETSTEKKIEITASNLKKFDEFFEKISEDYLSEKIKAIKHFPNKIELVRDEFNSEIITWQYLKDKKVNEIKTHTTNCISSITFLTEQEAKSFQESLFKVREKEDTYTVVLPKTAWENLSPNFQETIKSTQIDDVVVLNISDNALVKKLVEAVYVQGNCTVYLSTLTLQKIEIFENPKYFDEVLSAISLSSKAFLNILFDDLPPFIFHFKNFIFSKKENENIKAGTLKFIADTLIEFINTLRTLKFNDPRTRISRIDSKKDDTFEIAKIQSLLWKLTEKETFIPELLSVLEPEIDQSERPYFEEENPKEEIPIEKSTLFDWQTVCEEEDFQAELLCKHSQARKAMEPMLPKIKKERESIFSFLWKTSSQSNLDSTPRSRSASVSSLTNHSKK